MAEKNFKLYQLVLLALVACLLALPQPAQAAQAKHLILIIGDGMHFEHERAGSLYWTGSDTGLSFHQLPYQGQMATWDVSAYNAFAQGWDWTWEGAYSESDFQTYKGYSVEVAGETNTGGRKSSETIDRYFQDSLLYGSKPAATDSASAATAMYTGVKTDDGNISWRRGDPEGGALKTIGELMKEQKGASYGAVSTVQINHATPAAVYAHNVNRNNYSPARLVNQGLTTIAEELTTCGIDVAVGSGHPDQASRYFPEALIDAMKAKSDYVVVERASGVDGNASLLAAAEVAVAGGKKLFGLFGGPGGDFENRTVTDTPGSPDIDRGSRENPTFAALVTAALKVLAANPNGFFLMAEQGNLDWRNHSLDYKGMVGCVVDLHQGVQAAVDFVNQDGDDVTWDNTLLIVTSDHSNSYMRVKKPLGRGDLPPQEAVGSNSYGPVYDSSSYSGYVTYGVGEHTNELVSVYARGAGVDILRGYEGSWYPGTSLLDNTHIFWAMADAAGISSPNGRLTPNQ